MSEKLHNAAFDLLDVLEAVLEAVDGGGCAVRPENVAPLMAAVQRLQFELGQPAVQQTCVHPFNRLGIDADGVMWCVECLTKPLVIPVPFGASDNQSGSPRDTVS